MKNELVNSKTRKKRRAWPAKHRAHLAEKCRALGPSKQSTGPRTPEGRLKSASNAHKHGAFTGEMRKLRRLLGLQRKYLQTLKARHHGQKML